MSNVVPLVIPVRLECSKCGATTTAACDCGVGYEPASAKAAAAIAANPGKSNRALAAEIGISEPTVRRARRGASSDTPEKRTGRDGKSYPSKPQKQDTHEEPDVEDGTHILISEDELDDLRDKAAVLDGTSAEAAEKVFSRLTIRKARRFRGEREKPGA